MPEVLQGRRRLSERRLLITACDAGSANVLSAALPGWRGDFTLWTQGVASRKLAGTGIPFEAFPDDADPFELMRTDAMRDRLAAFGAVLAGTSWGRTLDKAVVLAARDRGLPTAALIEHWTLYRERFSTVEEGRIVKADVYMTDQIWLMDDVARADAVAAGLPAEKLVEVGQPYLESRRAQLLGVPATAAADSVVFVSERIRDDFRKGSPLYLGFDEYEAVVQVAAAARAAGLKLIVKLHPQEPADKFDALLGGAPDVTVVKEADVEGLIAGAAKIAGMVSMLLLEAALVRGDVISFMPGGEPSRFIGNRLGATMAVTDAGDLVGRLRAPRTAMAPAFGARFAGSRDRFVAALEELKQCA